MKKEVMINRHKVEVLINTGAEVNLISRYYLERMKLRPHKKDQPYDIEDIDGGKIGNNSTID